MQTSDLLLEVERVHAFIAAWFNGRVENSDAVFRAGLADRLAPALVNIQPSGAVLTRVMLLSSIRRGHAANPAFSIRISDARVRWFKADAGLGLVTYLEHQSGARNTTPADNTRISTVLFSWKDAGARPLWLHIHETAASVKVAG